MKLSHLWTNVSPDDCEAENKYCLWLSRIKTYIEREEYLSNDIDKKEKFFKFFSISNI